MAMKDNFLKEVKIGDSIEIMIGSKELEGFVVALDLDTVRIRRENGKEPVLSLDSISYYEVREDERDKDSLSKVITNTVKEIVREDNHPNMSNSISTKDVAVNEGYTPSTVSQSLQSVMFDFNAIESRGLVFETCYWQNDINSLKINPAIKDKVKALDPSQKLTNKLGDILNKIANCAKIDEFDPKFGRIQPIMRGINDLCEKYNEDFLYELLAIILINSTSTYKEALNKISTNRVIRLGDAVICYNKKRYEEMAYYCSEFYANVKLTEQNFDNFLFSIPYLVRNGYEEVLKSKREEVKKLSESRQIGFAAVYNNVKSSLAMQPSIYMPAKATNEFSGKLKAGSEIISKVLIDELKAKVEKLVHNGNFSEAYNIAEKRFKKNPENEELSELLQYVGRVKSNANKYKNLPSDGSFYAKALREWHIYENIPLAKTNFLLSINNKESKYFSAIMDYVELIMHTDGEKTAVEILTSYKETIRNLDSNSRIKYYEKLVSLYMKGKDYENLLQSLNSLKELYKTKLKRVGGNKVQKEKNQVKIAGTIFRIAQCQYMQGKYQQSIDTAKEALSGGHNLNACVNQIVSGYLSKNDYATAREIVKEYMGKDYNLLGLFEKIDTLEEAYNQKNSDDKLDNEPVDIYELLGFDNEFISYYEDNCEFEGISEEKKISKDFTNDDLRKIENEIKYVSKAKPKDLAAYYLTAACIEKELNDRSDKYYEFIANSMLYHGHLLLANRDFDCAKSFYLMSISMSQMTGKGVRIEKDALCSYMNAALKQAKTQTANEIKYESKIMILLPKLSDLIEQENSVLFDVIRLMNVSRQLKEFFMKNASQAICKKILDTVMYFTSWNQVDDQLWVKIGGKYKEAETAFNKWYAEVQLDKNFEHRIEDTATDVIKSLLVTNIDIEYINRYLRYCKEIREYRDYSDFDNRIRVLNQGINEMKNLITIGHNNSTLFFENYLLRIIEITLENVGVIVSRMGEDYKPEISIEVPITNIPSDNGFISLSVTISNADNKATARNISLTVLGLNNEELLKQPAKSNNLKGGAEISELLRIPIGVDEAFTLTIILNYEDDENEEYKVEKQISISTNAENFENILNPYITGKPVVNDKMFFGRDTLVKRLSDAICDDRIRCIIIYGQKRTGKSSIFDHLKRKLTNKFIVLNFSVGADITSENNFYKSVQKEFVEYLEDNNFDEDIIDLFDDYKIADFIDFEKFIGKINRSVIKPQNKELLLMIDEFTHIYTYIKNPNYDISENFMDKWKAMIEKDLFKSALIGQDFMPDFIQEYANQFQVTDPIYVSYLERKDAIDLVTKPVLMEDGNSRFLEGSEEMIVDWFNGQPYYLQTYCSRLVNYINEEQKQNYITAAVAKKVKDAMMASVQLDFFDNLVRADETDLCEVLLKIAQASDVPGSKVRVDRLCIDGKYKVALEKLANRGVIEYIKAEQKCRILIPFFHEWLMQSY
ncbi:ATP-binding protein [Ruminococcus sp. AM27-11LB]|uniref:ATP-binding protein n=1 Tax=Mediterraneibacter TaxID=2316020 RepID=UPI000E512B25|nr:MULTISPECIES: ATP-binding protein [Mediterraneibacter]RGH90925.1 ATP-binding protein [Ruminococcus sp. AM27-27]RGH92572.1 ATP-binding protein [Ruminococcus sp. AM27-11LB]